MEEEQRRNLEYPLDRKCYRNHREIGRAENVKVYKAHCLPLNRSLVAIKAIDLVHSRTDFDNIVSEAMPLSPSSHLKHPNILNAHCSFAFDHYLWVVMPFMSAGSIHSIVSYAFPDGLPEPCIAIVLRETLKALSYLHDQGHAHRDVKSGNILVNSDGSVKLADFGISASVYELITCSSNSFGTPYCRAPEVGRSREGYSLKADIWSFGVTALELAHGRPPSKFAVLERQKKKLSLSFKDMVRWCLDQDPSKRPPVKKLLKHSFFKNCREPQFLIENVLHGLPSVEHRFRKNSLSQLSSRKMSKMFWNIDSLEGNEKPRVIFEWKFNIESSELEPVFRVEK